MSIVCFFLLGSHLLYKYLYVWAKSVPIEWGTVNEAIIWSFPHFNPLIPSDDHNGYINELLYRSILKYSPKTKTFEADLMSCDLDDLNNISCQLENNLQWSDGTPITTDDIKATLNIISQTQVNPIIASLLENTTIEVTPETISFVNENRDINFLQVFLQPIIPKTIVGNLNSENVDGKFSEVNGIYSGNFIIKNISQDDTIWVTKITLEKNTNYFWNTMYIQFLILNLYQDEAHFLKNKNSFNIYNDTGRIIGKSIPRLNILPYTLSQFVWVFANTETLGKTLRQYVLWNLDRETVTLDLGNDRVTPTLNPFLSDISIDQDAGSFDIQKYMSEKNYYTKEELIEIIETSPTLPPEQIISAEVTLDEPTEPKPEQELLTFVVSPNSQKYNFVSQDDILVKWNAPEWIDAVYINDYKLTEFNPGDNEFFYRLSESYETIAPWENTYEVYFEIQGEKELKETFVYIYNTNETELAQIQKDFFAPEEKPTWTVVPTSSSTTLTQEDAQKLDSGMYYDIDGKPYTLKLIYAQTDALMEKAADSLKKQLANIGITLDTHGLSLGDIAKWLRDESLKYDMVLIGINLWYFDSNIFPYFHSSQVENGYNFANYKQLGLDILLEELKSNMLSVSKTQELESKILDILQQNNIIKTFYTSKIEMLVDKNIKDFTFPDHIPDTKLRYRPLLNAYLDEKRTIQLQNKSFIWFFQYLWNELW